MPGEFDMRRMQEDAARRAREMQSRARVPRPRPEPPKEAPPPEPSPPPPPPAGTPAPAALETAPASLLGNLFQDKERTVLLALLILLGSEEGSQELMFALLFLLM